MAKGSWFPGKEAQDSGTLAGRKSTDIKDMTSVKESVSLIFMRSQDEAKNPLGDCVFVNDVNSDINQHPPLPPTMCWFPEQAVILTWSSTESNFPNLEAFTY